MAVTEVAKIQVRHGLQENLPQLDAGEFGWCTDTRRLFIGNGVTGDPDYAPVIGNTEILTVVSNATLEANIAILQSNVASLQSQLGISTATLTDNTGTLSNISVSGNVAISVSTLQTRTIDYNIIRGTTSRVGIIKITNSNGVAFFEDEYAETASTGVNLNFANIGGSAVLQYTTTSTTQDATFNYYIKSFT